MPNAAPDAADRFTGDVARLIGHAPAARHGVAVSGGPDSMALLYLAARAFPGRVEAATIDHGLRAEAAEEAAMVARWCADHAIPHATLKPAEPITGNLQSAARAARYALLAEWRVARGIDWLMTAHHADDQLETLLMRLNRGSGVGGLAGVRARSGHLLRPLLDWRRSELRTLAEGQGLPFALDPSNGDPRFDRAALRRHLAGVEWLDPRAAVRSSAALAEAEEALAWMAADIAGRAIAGDGECWSLTVPGIADMPRELRRRLLLHLLSAADPTLPPPRGNTLDHALARIDSGGKTSLGNWLLSGGPRWSACRAPPRRA
ncbi:tRNA lysidine(34) synthetase TilS [Sphingobium arseniciresistens]|uniref:tRNA lysidine(34) synthetase TilS n=1 Tax=Sphingobium arseniciresistens TaxID=3030834 RepID=UPI003BB18B8D